ncbi:hypothetical protein BMQ_1872 [Priestia megaterium QM B1551]|uniref:Uncharacterized protein n=1 Tax=Priestia megaterium (strain ATCC 12872 / QMB1551) TaxID=545693 RepID=D5DPI0_PRIM1|nr:hypothetical protein BMQ_1872 [Priestia megaterium QM B1551]
MFDVLYYPHFSFITLPLQSTAKNSCIHETYVHHHNKKIPTSRILY